MRQPYVRGLSAVAIALLIVLTAVVGAHAGGVVFIDSCQTLSTPNTVQKVTTDLTSCGDCLVVDGDRITIDLQGHSIVSSCPPVTGIGITEPAVRHDVLVIKNGAISGFAFGIALTAARSSIIGMDVSNNFNVGIITRGDNVLINNQ